MSNLHTIGRHALMDLQKMNENNAEECNRRMNELHAELDALRSDRDKHQALARAIGEYLK